MTPLLSHQKHLLILHPNGHFAQDSGNKGFETHHYTSHPPNYWIKMRRHIQHHFQAVPPVSLFLTGTTSSSNIPQKPSAEDVLILSSKHHLPSLKPVLQRICPWQRSILLPLRLCNITEDGFSGQIGHQNPTRAQHDLRVVQLLLQSRSAAPSTYRIYKR